MNDKRNIDGYGELFNFQLAGRLVILAENAKADEPFLVCLARWDNPLGAEVYYDASITSDYLEAVKKFIRQEAVLLDALGLQRDLSSLPFKALTAADCVPQGMESDIKSKLVVIKPEALSPEYRSAEYQLGICRTGFGCRPDASGTAVYIDKLSNGETSRFERYEIAGVADPARLPEWAKVKLRELESASLGNQESDLVYGEQAGRPAPKVDGKQTDVERNAACAASIDKAIQASYLGDYRYDLKAAAKSVTEEYGARRVAAVLAANLSDADYDGRFSAANKAWARNYGEQPDTGAQPRIVINTHRAILDGFVTKFRGIYEGTPNKKPSLHHLMDTTKQELAAKNVERPKNASKSNDIEK